MVPSLHDFMLRCVYSSLATVETDLVRLNVYTGWHLESHSAPEIEEQRKQGASFEWVAVGCSPLPMFDLHAGIVLGEGQLSVGIHAHERLNANAAIASAIHSESDIHYQYSPTVREIQYNYPSQSIEQADCRLLSRQLSECIELLPVVLELVRPGAIRSDE